MTETIARDEDQRLPLSMPVLLSFVAGYVDRNALLKILMFSTFNVSYPRRSPGGTS